MDSKTNPPQHRDGQQQHGLHQVGADHERESAPAVDNGSDDEAEDQIRQPPCGVEPTDVRRRAVERENHQRLKSEQGYVGAESRDRVGTPVPQERSRGKTALLVTLASLASAT